MPKKIFLTVGQQMEESVRGTERIRLTIKGKDYYIERETVND